MFDFCDVEDEKKIFVDVLCYPFLIRSVQSSDFILSANGDMRDITKILSSWHISEIDRWKVPIIQELKSESQNVIAIFGCVLEKPNWIVKNMLL